MTPLSRPLLACLLYMLLLVLVHTPPALAA
jgi:hypothetical protein